MATVAWVVMKHHRKEDGTYNPKIRISHNRTSSYVPTPIYTEMVRFKKGSSTGIVTSEQIKEELDTMVSEYRRAINSNPSAVMECETSKEVLELIRKRNESRNIDFVDYAKKIISQIHNAGTRKVKTTCINSLCLFLEYKGMERLSINKLTSSFLREYEAWLRASRVVRVKTNGSTEDSFRDCRQNPLNSTGIRLRMTVIKTIFNQALLEFNDYETGNIVITNNPWKAYSIPPALMPEKRAVDAGTIRKIYNYHSGNEKTQLVRDLYVLSFLLAGMNVADMFDCKIKDGRVEYKRKKTRERRQDRAFISVYIHPMAMEIINKYDDGTGKTVFDMVARRKTEMNANAMVMRGMRAICYELGIENIQFYSARHSFATIARNDCGFSKDDIAVCLNHSSGRSVTDAYIREDFSIIERVIKKVVGFVFDK